MMVIKTAFALALLFLLASPAQADVLVVDDGLQHQHHHSWLRIGPAAHYSFDEHFVFSLDVAVTTPLGPNVAIGGRFGGAVATRPATFGVPLDVLFDFYADRFIFELAGGPWIFFPDGEVQVLGHAAAHLGIRMGGFSFGPEVGWLEPSGIIGLRFSFYL